MKLYPHQNVAADWLAARPRAGLFDDQGLGKTISAIEGARRVGAKRILVLAPTVVVHNWAREVRQFAPEFTTQVVDHGRAEIGSANFVIVTHGLSIRAAISSQIRSQRWDLCVVDEAHFFRGPNSQRSRSLYGLDDRDADETTVGVCARTWLLTGTPIPNDASDLWTHVRGLWPSTILDVKGKPGSYEAFRDVFCVTRQTRYGPKVVSNRNVSVLRALLKDVTLRRLKRDVLKDLPPIRFELISLRPQVMPWEIQRVLDDLPAKVIAEARKAAEDDPGKAWRKLKNLDVMPRLRRLAGLAKVEPIAELLKMEMEHGAVAKVVIFAHHTEVIETMTAALAPLGAVMIHGGVRARDRDDIVDAFQTNPRVRVVVCQITAAGTGITLTASTEVVFVEASFTPGDNAQAADRCHRIGQTGRVRVRFVALADTVDEDVMSILRTKTEMIREVLE